MLKDAALLQLDVTRAALDEDMTLKDATAFNVQWCGARPTFIDIGSFTAYVAGEPWAGYRQFCETFLYPLLLQGVPQRAVSALAAGQPGGHHGGAVPCVAVRPPSAAAAACWPTSTCRRRRRHATRIRRGDVRHELRAAGFGAALIKHNIDRLRRTVRAAELGTWALHLVGVSAGTLLRRRRPAAQGGFRRTDPGCSALAAGLGSRVQHRPLFPSRRETRGLRPGSRCRPRRRRASVPGARC